MRQPDGGLSDCERAADCVRSGDPDPARDIAPLRYAGTAQDARRRLLVLLQEELAARIVVSVPNYVHAEVEPVVGPIDDLEFLFSAHEPRIDLRASTRGRTLAGGGNRTRLEALRRRFESP